MTERPYRLYRTGRGRPVRRSGATRAPGGAQRQPPLGSHSRRFGRWGRKQYLLAAGTVASLALVGIVVWLALGYLAVSAGLAAANKRLPASVRAVLENAGGSLLSTPTNVLLLGIDHSAAADRTGDHHSDSIMLLRADSAHHRLVYLSIPRDLVASIPGVGDQKINAAMQFGGAALAVRTIGAFTGLPINHVVVVDFASFSALISAVGGITVDVPEAIVSDRFDCPYSPARCTSWTGWHFARGVQHMDARQALVYSRIRVNRLNPADSDATRALHQQQVMQAVMSKLASIDTLVRLPFDGGSLLRPLATDLSALDLVELGWIKFRASTVLHCRLGGAPDGQGNLLPSSSGNAQVIREALGEARPQAPLPSAGIYAPGCVSGNHAFPS